MADKRRTVTGSTASADTNRSGSQPDLPKVRKPWARRRKVQGTDKFLKDTLVNNSYVIESLTRREREVLKLVVSGKTNRQIAEILSRTERTVEYHRNRMMRKLGTHNVADLVRRAVAMGIEDPLSNRHSGMTPFSFPVVK